VRHNLHERRLGHLGRRQGEDTIATVFPVTVRPQDACLVECLPYGAVQPATDHDLVVIGAAPIPSTSTSTMVRCTAGCLNAIPFPSIHPRLGVLGTTLYLLSPTVSILVELAQAQR